MPQYHTYYPNYEKLYPGIEKRPDILRVLRASDRKMRYMEWQLQTERFVEDQEKQNAVFLPSRETSLEQMDEEKHQFVDERPGPEEQLTQSERLQLLRRALKSLTSAEREVIQSLYFEDLTERQLSELIGVPQKTINDRKRRAISKPRKFFIAACLSHKKTSLKLEPLPTMKME